MKFLGLLTVGVMLWSSQLLAGPSQAEVKQLNNNLSIDHMVTNLKGFFTTSEDHRLIESNFELIRNSVQGWHWRAEVAGDKIAFRVNGKIQVYLQSDPKRPGVYFLNGKELSLVPGQSYQSYLQKVEGIFKSTNVKLEDLFIQEAYAEPVTFFIGLVAGLILCEFKCKGGKCSVKPIGGKGGGSKGSQSVGTVVSQADCSVGLRDRRHNKKYGLRGKDKIWFTSSQMKTTYQYWGRRGTFNDVPSCVRYKKIHDPRNYSEDRYRAICREVERVKDCKGTTTTVIVEEKTCTSGKGKGKGSCENRVPIGTSSKCPGRTKREIANLAFSNPDCYELACAMDPPLLEGCGSTSTGGKSGKSGK